MISAILPFDISKFKPNVRAFLKSKKLFTDLVNSTYFILSKQTDQPISISFKGRQVAAIGKPSMQIWFYHVFACTKDGKFIVHDTVINWDKVSIDKLKAMADKEIANRDIAVNWFRTGNKDRFRVKDGTLVLDEKMFKKYW